MYYSTIGLIAILVLLLENQDVLLNKNNSFGMAAWRVYRRFLYAVLVYYFTDVLWGVFEYIKYRRILFTDTLIYFIAMAVGVLFWTRYVVIYLDEKNRFGRFLVYAGRIFALVVAVLSTVNIFVPVIFDIDEDCVYHANGIRYVLLLFQILLLIMISIYALSSIVGKNNTQDKMQRYRTMVYFGMIMASFLFAQLWFPYLPLYTIANMLGTCLLRAFVIGDEKEEYKQALEKDEKKKESIAYNRLNALWGDSLCTYVIEPETGQYREFTASNGFRNFNLPKDGEDFFGVARERGSKIVFSEDLERFMDAFSYEKVLKEVREKGIYSITYRLMINEKPNYVKLKAAMVEEEEGSCLIVGINDIDYHVRQEQEYQRRLNQAQSKANIDALTGVRNKHAYLTEEERLNAAIEENSNTEFAIVILDLNDLKKINDTIGHKEGDRFIREACRIICKIFKHSPVFRIGGDEFTVVVQGEDYECIDELIETINEHNAEALKSDGIVIACGMSRAENDSCVATVFERADKNMYDNKSYLKSLKKQA